MALKLAKISHSVYGFDAVTDQGEVAESAARIYRAVVPKKRLMLIGGTHGYDPTGIPVRQTAAERLAPSHDVNSATVGGVTVSSFALEDHAIARLMTEVKFTYKNIAKLCGTDGEINAIKTNQLVMDIRRMDHSGDWAILLTWCFSVIWARSHLL